jgi:hypothetical protein
MEIYNVKYVQINKYIISTIDNANIVHQLIHILMVHIVQYVQIINIIIVLHIAVIHVLMAKYITIIK